MYVQNILWEKKKNIISKCFTFQQTAETFCKCSFNEQTNKQPGILCHVGTSVVLVFSIL